MAKPKTKPNDDIDIRSVTVTRPGGGDTVQVDEVGGGGSGPICITCAGMVDPAAGVTFNGLYFRVHRDGGSYTPDEVTANPDQTLSSSEIYGTSPPGPPIGWTLNKPLVADCGAAGSEQANRLHVVELGYGYVAGTGYTAIKNLVTVDFRGRCADCARLVVPTAEEDAADDQGADTGRFLRDTAKETESGGGRLRSTAMLSGGMASPSNSDGEWRFYGGLTAANHHFGNRLYLHGAPLRARLIAVAAEQVHWSYNLAPVVPGRRRHVRRPVGDLTSFHSHPSPMRFANSPSDAIVIYQPIDWLPEHVVSATHRTAADLISLQEDADILVQVNYNHLFQHSITGTFGLWIKVID